MCNACGNVCCGSDEFGGCGCDGCDCPECWSEEIDERGEEDEPCPTCRGQKTINPLTAPDRPGLLVLGTEICPDCEGSGTFDY